MKKEFKVISDLLHDNTRVLDVGCGDGSLMNFLKEEKNIEVRGLELNQDNVQQCIHKGLPVIQGNAETELHQFPDQSFDYVVLSQTLQAFSWCSLQVLQAPWQLMAAMRGCGPCVAALQAEAFSMRGEPIVRLCM